MLGAGCGLLSGTKSTVRGIVCGLAGLALGIYTYWTMFPFVADDSLSYFVKNAHSVPEILDCPMRQR